MDGRGVAALGTVARTDPTPGPRQEQHGLSLVPAPPTGTTDPGYDGAGGPPVGERPGASLPWLDPLSALGSQRTVQPGDLSQQAPAGAPTGDPKTANPVEPGVPLPVQVPARPVPTGTVTVSPAVPAPGADSAASGLLGRGPVPVLLLVVTVLVLLGVLALRFRRGRAAAADSRAAAATGTREAARSPVATGVPDRHGGTAEARQGSKTAAARPSSSDPYPADPYPTDPYPADLPELISAHDWASSPEAKDGLAEQLGRLGVTMLAVAAGDPIDPRMHNVVATRPAEPGQEGTVAEVVRPGWRDRTGMLRPADVMAFIAGRQTPPRPKALS